MDAESKRTWDARDHYLDQKFKKDFERAHKQIDRQNTGDTKNKQKIKARREAGRNTRPQYDSRQKKKIARGGNITIWSRERGLLSVM